MKALMLLIAACVAMAFAGCGDDSNSDTTGTDETVAAEVVDVDIETKPVVVVPDGDAPTALVKNDLLVGDGAEAKKGDSVSVQYVGVGFDSGEEFDASWNRGEPFEFELGSGMVIPGWEEGVEGMKVGGRRELVIPSDLAYGPAGSPPVIGPNETLIFVVDLVDVN